MNGEERESWENKIFVTKYPILSLPSSLKVSSAEEECAER